MDYKEELEQFISKLRNTTDIPRYFVDLYEDTQRPKVMNKKKNVGIIGDEYYSLYVRASGLTPVFLNGGSYFMGENMSHIFPQISDPVAKATLGLLLDEELGIYKDVGTVIITATNDSYKKALPYLRELNINIIEIEPSTFILEKMPFSYVTDQLAVLNDISKIANTRLSEKILKNELMYCKKAHDYTKVARWKSLPTLEQDFILHTLYLTEDKERWCKEVGKYLQTVEVLPQGKQILMMGSALKFPCSKMYEIFSDIGIDHFENVCIELPDYYGVSMKKSALALMRECFKFQYKHGFCSQTLANPDQYKLKKDIQGIVYHLLKGQVSSAYEAEQIEKAAIAQGVPFICVETDYTYADKEQIKIRIEAFNEMLKSKAKAETQVS